MKAKAWAVALAALVACGDGKGAKTPEGSGAGPSGSAQPVGTAGSGTGSPVGPSSIGKPVASSAMAADLTAIGLDPKALPALEKMPPEQLRKVMKTFTKALGTTCNGCHDPNDYRAPTPDKRVAARMWDLYVRGLAMEDGTPVYCDSCHGGRTRFLDRHDDKGLRTWMDANFVSKLKRVDGKPHACESCHGDPFQPKILAAWAKR